MSLTSGAYKVHFLLQQVVPTPYAVELQSCTLTSCKSHQSRFHKIFRNVTVLSLEYFAIPLYLYRLFWLFFNWKSFTIVHVDQIIVHIFPLTAAAIFIPAYFTINNYSNELKYLINQICKIAPLISENRPRFNIIVNLPFAGKTSILELLVYGLSSAFFTLVLGFIALPFAISYEPIQWLLGSSNFFVKSYQKEFFATLPPYIFPKVRIPIYCMFDLFGAMEVLIFVGVICASSAAFMTLKLYGMLNIFMYLLGPAATKICFALALMLTYLANFPYKNTKLFKLYWKQFVTRKENRKLLRACMPYGFDLGPYGIARAMLGLNICDDIIRNTVTMILLGGL